MEQIININRFLDDSGKIVQLAQKQKTRYVLLQYISEKFESNRDYTEKEVNDLCCQWIDFGDYFLLRRELIDHGLLCRERDGSRYWKPQSSHNNTAEEVDCSSAFKSSNNAIEV